LGARAYRIEILSVNRPGQVIALGALSVSDIWWSNSRKPRTFDHTICRARQFRGQ